MLIGSNASSESTRKPAVSQVNGTVSGFYSGSYRSGWDLPFAPDTQWNSTGGIAAAAYLPGGKQFGLSVSGGGRWGGTDDWTTSPGLVTTSRDLSAFSVGADLFWRNPESGFVRLFYDYSRTRIEYPGLVNPGWLFPASIFQSIFFQALSKSEVNDLRLVGGVYLEDIEFTFDAGYERSSGSFQIEGLVLGEGTDDGYEFGAGVAAYPGASDRVLVGIALRGGQVAAGDSVGDLIGVAYVNWLPDFFGNRFVRLGGSVGGGAYIASDESQPFVTVGFSVSIDLPGADNLKQLFREMQI